MSTTTATQPEPREPDAPHDDVYLRPALPKPRLRAEVLIVLGLSLGQSAIYAALNLLNRYLAEPSIGSQTTTLNPSRASIDYMDLTYQLLHIFFGLMPVALALYLLSGYGDSFKTRLGLTGPGRFWAGDVGKGAILAACIGLPGLALYAFGRAIGQTVRVDTSGLPDLWWTAMILLMSAAAAAILEEVVVVGYLVTRLTQMRWSAPVAIAASALLRGSYHLYQGWPMALGNAVMGAVFAYAYLRWRRVGPLVAAHFLLDFVSFVGPEFAPQSWLDAINAT